MLISLSLTHGKQLTLLWDRVHCFPSLRFVCTPPPPPWQGVGDSDHTRGCVDTLKLHSRWKSWRCSDAGPGIGMKSHVERLCSTTPRAFSIKTPYVLHGCKVICVMFIPLIAPFFFFSSLPQEFTHGAVVACVMCHVDVCSLGK